MKRIALFLLALACAPALAATIADTTCTEPDVQKALNVAAAGDTVTVPAGSCTWAAVTATKPVRLIGANTTITASGSGDALSLTVGASRTELAGFRFMPGKATGNYVSFGGSGIPPYMHDMYFNLPNFQLQHAVGWYVAGGVISKVTFESTDNLGAACGSQVGSDSGSLVVKSPTSWDLKSTMGANDTTGDANLYIEDSVFSNVGQSPDLDDNARVVIRHNQFIASSGLTHGTTSTTGARHVEIYDNVMTYPNTNRNFNRYFWFRAGTGVVTGNSMQTSVGPCYGSKPSMTFSVENAQRSDGGHGCCTGYQCFHQPGTGSDGTAGHSNLSAGQSPPSAYQISEPIYIWGNTGTGADESLFVTGEGQPLQCGTGQFKTSTFFVRGRDWFVNAGPKPGWTRYPYPHPVTTGTVIVPVPPIPPPTGDTTPPTAPASLTAALTALVTWTAATDNVGVTGYLVERCTGAACTSFTQIAGPIPGTSFADSGLPAGSNSYRVRATDAAGNLGGYTPIGTVTIGPPAPLPAKVTIGETNVLATASPLRNSIIYAQPVTLTALGNLASMSVFVDSFATGATLQMGVYSDKIGPSQRLAVTVSATAVAGWNTLAIKGTLPAGNYWLLVNNTGNPDITLRTGAPGPGRFAGGYFGLPATAPAMVNIVPQHWSLYATLN